MSKLLEINNLIVSFENPNGELTAVKGVSLDLDKGEILALVGESGCGKTVLCKSMLKVLCAKGNIRHGEIKLDEENLISLTEEEMQTRRGSDIAMIFQDPMTSLDPAFSVGDQIAEVLRIHKNLNKSEAKMRAIELMELVQIPDADKRYDQRPYQFSGGMRQRVVIAAALAAEPKLLLADEPTTALDEETQEEIIRLLKHIQREIETSMIFITHDLSIVEDVANRVAVMKDGLLVEEGYVSEVFKNPQHEYTRKLLGYLDYKKNRGHNHRGKSDMDSKRTKPVISVRDLNVRFKVGKNNENQVLDNFCMDIYKGEIVGIVGKSGCGKSTLARCIMGLEKYNGEIYIADNINAQMIFQDTGSVFNDRMTIREVVGEPLVIKSYRTKSARNIEDDIDKVLEEVELDLTLADRKPYELSGGQRQRVAIARALITEPDVIIADEPLTGLDVTAQAQMIHLFKKLSEQNDIAVVFIAHDLPMVNHISDRIIKMS